MIAKDLEELPEEYRTILENIEVSLSLVQESLREVSSNTADDGQLLARLLSIRVVSHNSDAAIARAGEMLTLSPYVKRRPRIRCAAYAP